MDNQNTNGLGGLNTNNSSNETITPVPNPIPTDTNAGPVTIGGMGTSSTPVEPSLQGNLNQSAEPVKPTLDSILNGTPVSPQINSMEGNVSSNVEPVPMEARPIVEEVPPTPIISPVNSVSEVPVVDTSASTMNNGVVQETPSIPVVETIPETPSPLGMTQENLVNQSMEMAAPVETLESSISATQSEVPPVVPIENIEQSAIPTQSASPTLASSSVETLSPEPTIDNSVSPVDTMSTPTDATPQDDFGAVPVPPVFDDGKKKKEKKERNKDDSKKTIIVVLLIILIAAIGFGVYYFLSMAKSSANQASIVLKDVKLELGNTMSSNIDDYATITGYDKNSCTIDLSSVDVNKVSSYKYQVTCGKVVQEGTIIVDDSESPKVTTQDVVLLPNATLNAEDFIEKCTDASSCSYKFAEDYTGLTEKVGEYEVQLVVSDNFNNETKVNAKLTVSRNAPVKYLTCTSKEETLEDIPATLVHSYRIGVDGKDNFFNATRTSLFTYNTLEDYNTAIRSYDASVGIHGIIGTEVLNEADKSISIKTDKTLKEMNQDLNGNLPENASVLRAYLFGIGYTCN